jgi:hypothetical protein
MKDHTYIRENGERVLVAQMTTFEIGEVLRDGVQIDADEDATVAQIIERLHIELIIRTIL